MKITQLGKELSKDKYVIDLKAKSFSTTEDNLVLDFSNEHGWVFKTGSYCTFKTGSNCTFNTGYNCTFDTGYYCTFNTGSNCTFNTGSNCTFDTGYYCTFNTGSYCTFNTGSNCTFDTGYYCTFNTDYYCTFKTGSECVAVRRDIYEVIEIPKGKTIRLNGYGVKGYVAVEEPEPDLVKKL